MSTPQKLIVSEFLLLVNLCTNKTGLVLFWGASAAGMKTGTTAEIKITQSLPLLYSRWCVGGISLRSGVQITLRVSSVGEVSLTPNNVESVFNQI